MHVHAQKWDERQILIPVGANQQRGSTLKSVRVPMGPVTGPKLKA